MFLILNTGSFIFVNKNLMLGIQLELCPTSASSVNLVGLVQNDGIRWNPLLQLPIRGDDLHVRVQTYTSSY